MRTGARLWEAAGAAALIPVLVAPAADPDLWWHLSAGRRFLATGIFPRADWLSWTRPGAPWVDFEWMSQAALAAAHLAGGLWGVWALKAWLLLLAAGGVLVTARVLGLAAPGRAAALALFAAGVLPRADVRTELFSLAAFSWTLAGLSRLRATGWPAQRYVPAAAAAFALFAMWASLHAGFVVGLALAAAFSAEAAWHGRREWVAVPVLALAATFANPYGPGVWSVMFSHARESGALRGLILEWGPLEPWRLSHAGAWAVLAAAAGVVVLAAGRGRVLPAPELLALALAASSFRHARLCGYAAVCAPLLAASAARLWPSLWELALPRRAAAALCGAALLFSLAAARPWRLMAGPYDYVLVPRTAAAWLEEHPDLRDLKLYNPWSWGGYLAWRLKVPVYQDGRYIFHDLLEEQGRATASPEAWGGFLNKSGAELALMENAPPMLPTTRRERDGTERRIARPYFALYMPRETWALVWFDDAALVYMRRDRMPEGLPEYRWLKPRDEAALQDARVHGEVDEGALADEKARWDAERAGLAGR